MLVGVSGGGRAAGAGSRKVQACVLVSKTHTRPRSSSGDAAAPVLPLPPKRKMRLPITAVPWPTRGGGTEGRGLGSRALPLSRGLEAAGCGWPEETSSGGPSWASRGGKGGAAVAGGVEPSGMSSRALPSWSRAAAAAGSGGGGGAGSGVGAARASMA